MSSARGLLLVAALASSLLAQTQPVHFERELWPSLYAACVSCHGPSQAKAGLRLDAKAGFLRGSGGGPVLVPGKPNDSLLYTLTALPKGDPDLMPAKADPLPSEVVAKLKRWIEEGADFGDFVGGTVPGHAEEQTRPEVVPEAVQRQASFLEGLKPPGDQALHAAREAGLVVGTVEPSGRLLRVGFQGVDAEHLKKALEETSRLGPWVHVLDLSRTTVSDDDLKRLPSLPRLVRLDLRQTAITDRGLMTVARWSSLESLNLFATKVGDQGLASLEKLANLRRLTLWQSAVTEAAAARFREQHPTVQVVGAPELPEPAAREPETPRRRRGNQ